MRADLLQPLLALFKNRKEAINPDSRDAAYRRGYEAALEKCIEDVVMQAESAPPERKIVQISGSEYRWALCNDGSTWRIRSCMGNPPGLIWERLPPIPQGEST